MERLIELVPVARPHLERDAKCPAHLGDIEQVDERQGTDGVHLVAKADVHAAPAQHASEPANLGDETAVRVPRPHPLCHPAHPSYPAASRATATISSISASGRPLTSRWSFRKQPRVCAT